MPPPEEYFPNLDFPCVEFVHHRCKCFIPFSKVIVYASGGFGCVEVRRCSGTLRGLKYRRASATPCRGEGMYFLSHPRESEELGHQQRGRGEVIGFGQWGQG